ncbi:MAG: hypothetical protein M1325_04475 [Actinobacteria bacterium]|nr:hypothetical protein [Actinomycetota bacterium]
MGGPQSQASARRALARKREADALELRLGGATYEQIAARLGYKNRSGALRAVLRSLDRLIEPQEVEQLRRLELERLDRLLLGIWYSAVHGEAQAIDRVLKILERRARLLGLDAPVRQEHSGPGGGPIQHEHLSESELDREIRRLMADVARFEEEGLGCDAAELPPDFEPPV